MVIKFGRMQRCFFSVPSWNGTPCVFSFFLNKGKLKILAFSTVHVLRNSRYKELCMKIFSTFEQTIKYHLQDMTLKMVRDLCFRLSIYLPHVDKNETQIVIVYHISRNKKPFGHCSLLMYWCNCSTTIQYLST